MEVKNACRRCGEVNIVNSKNLISEDAWDLEGNYYKIMYYDCKRCKERIVLQIDDIDSLNLFREFKRLIIRVSRKQINHQTIGKKDIKKKDKYTRELKDRREKLKSKCEGIKLLDKDKNIIVEVLTFPRVGDIIESNL